MSKQENANKQTARALEKAMASIGYPLKHGQALNVVAAMAGYSHFGAMPQSTVAGDEPAPVAHIERHHMLRLPSVDGSSYDRFVTVPVGMDFMAAIALANRVIVEVNYEDSESADGCCADGESVEDNIRRRLEAQGFSFMSVESTLNWDEAHGEPEKLDPGSSLTGAVPRRVPSDRLDDYDVWVQVCLATLYLDGQAMLGEPRVVVSRSKADVRQIMLEEYWDPRLDSASATPVVTIEQLDDGSYTGPFAVMRDGKFHDHFNLLLTAVREAAAMHGSGGYRVSVEDADGTEIFVLKADGVSVL